MAAALLVVGAVAAGGLAAAPAGNASCMSVFGRNNTDQCFSSPTGIAIALGDSAVAFADGKYLLAFADGRGVVDPPAGCDTAGGGGDRCTRAAAGATGNPDPSRFGVAVARGEGATAAVGMIYTCVGCIAVSADPWDATVVSSGRLNAVIAVGNRNVLGANPTSRIDGGSGNLAALIGTRYSFPESSAGGVDINGKGNRNVAVRLGVTMTQANPVRVGAPGQPANSSVAFDLGGGRRLAGNNTVTAVGDRAVAGAIGQRAVTVKQNGQGRNIIRRQSA